ncbi:MAG: hypothetical protein HEQ13_27210 [Dolichospermum sp. DEX189]|nr:hypothetical protein [Dolichospermum sp. DEX189]
MKAQASSYNRSFAQRAVASANITPEMGVGFQIPIKNLVSILISTAVKTARVASLSALKGLSFPLTAISYEVRLLSNWTKIFTVIASEGKQSQPLELLDFTSFHMANATQRLRNEIV